MANQVSGTARKRFQRAACRGRRDSIQRRGVGFAIVLCATAGGVAAQEVVSGYEAERGGWVPEWIVISNHFRHSENCTSDGCVVMGPMTDRAACEEWSRRYNKIDPFDHTRCVSAKAYNIRDE